MQALLAERFQLGVRKEQKDLPAYVLVLAKGGFKLKDSPPDEPAKGVRRVHGLIAGRKASMDLLVPTLSMVIGRPVIDRTGLAGKYDFDMRFTEEPGMSGSGFAGLKPGAPPSAGAEYVESGPSLFTAIQEQLGLKLEATRGPVDYYVIERVERPSAN